jgi:hypothetical protein
MLTGLVLLSTAAFIASGALVGGRLLALALRTRELTDFLVGASLLLLSGISYPLSLASGLDATPLATARALAVASAVGFALGWVGVYHLTQRVFRRGDRSAQGLALLGSALLVIGTASRIQQALVAPDAATLRNPQGIAFLVEGAALLVYLWTAAEGFAAFAQARRRLPLGLADPVVANRFGLWGCVGVCAFISVAPGYAIAVTGGDSMASQGALLATAFGGLACSAALQLAFLPPAAYLRWLRATAPRVA